MAERKTVQQEGEAMKSWVLLVGIMLGFVSLPPTTIAGDTPEAVLAKLAQQYFARVNKGNFAEAATLFHYPKQYTLAEQSKEGRSVTQLLTILTREFGSPSHPRVPQQPFMIYNVGGGSGDIPYWQQHPTSLQKQYEVTFTREATGYVIIQFCKIAGVWEIRGVQYGLSVQRPEAKTRIADIQNMLMREMSSAPEQ